MVQAYNFLASWQLFPEKGVYEFGERPKSGIYKIEAVAEKKELQIFHNWVTLENQAFSSGYRINADGEHVAGAGGGDDDFLGDDLDGVPNGPSVEEVD